MDAGDPTGSTEAALGTGTLLFSDAFSSPNNAQYDLITNEYATYNPGCATASPPCVVSPNWTVTSGTLFWQSGAGWSGVSDLCSGPVSEYSQGCNNSDVFRMNTKLSTFTNARVELDLDITAIRPHTTSSSWDGVHILVRRVNETNLYTFSVERRDGALVIKRKCPGGTTNGGTYYTLASTAVNSYPIALGKVQHVAASATTHSDGTVTLDLYRGNTTATATLLLTAKDAGRTNTWKDSSGTVHTQACPPITTPAEVGLRGDYMEFTIDNFDVYSGS